jgi:hypothetical protein
MREKSKSPAKLFDQAFPKLDAWFESTRGLNAYGVISKSQYIPSPNAKDEGLVEMVLGFAF